MGSYAYSYYGNGTYLSYGVDYGYGYKVLYGYYQTSDGYATSFNDYLNYLGANSDFYTHHTYNANGQYETQVFYTVDYKISQAYVLSYGGFEVAFQSAVGTENLYYANSNYGYSVDFYGRVYNSNAYSSGNLYSQHSFTYAYGSYGSAYYASGPIGYYLT